MSVAWDPSGERIVCARGDCSVPGVVVGVTDGREVTQLKPPSSGYGHSAGWSADGRHVVLGQAGGHVSAWEVDGWRLMWSSTIVKCGLDMFRMAMSSDGRMVVVGSGGSGGGRATVLEMERGVVEREVGPSGVEGVAMSASGRLVAMTTGGGNRAIVSGESDLSVDVGGSSVCVAFLDGDGQMVAGAGKDAVLIRW